MRSIIFRKILLLMPLAMVLAAFPFPSFVTAQKQGGSNDKGREYYEARGEIVWEINTDEKVIALTFDDGPNAAQTPQILDLLKQYDAKATFFVVGKRMEKYPDLVRREANEGHELANHTYNHPYFKQSTPIEQIRQEILKNEQLITSLTRHKPRLFRPPGGFYSENIVEASKEAGYLTVLWSWHQDTKDWRSPGVDKIVRKVLDNARNGDIVLFHDHVENNPQTVEALKQILPELKQRGFRFVTVSELLPFNKMESSVHS
ncbi:polysaccharide deacetylase family protein [Paenibacillus residui]|uniref:Polysaccharide deacetylase family protein n=1 Tax=Paenibacillus residui TaxID=629724 RepID=A0ABW3DD52_9BACL